MLLVYLIVGSAPVISRIESIESGRVGGDWGGVGDGDEWGTKGGV